MEYAFPEFLADTEWLAEHLYDDNLRIVDTDEMPAYFRAHIPGAVHIPVHHYLKDPSVMGQADYGIHVMTPQQMAELMGSLGIGDGTQVVAYDHSRSLYAARFWWVLRYYGHQAVKVLNGGWKKWLAEGRPITVERPKVTNHSRFTPRPDASLMVTTEELKGLYDKDGVVVWDVRNEGEFTGKSARGNRRAGHIPGAVHLEWLEMMDEETHMVKPAAELRSLLTSKGITPEKVVLAH